MPRHEDRRHDLGPREFTAGEVGREYRFVRLPHEWVAYYDEDDASVIDEVRVKSRRYRNVCHHQWRMRCFSGYESAKEYQWCIVCKICGKRKRG